MLPWQGLALAPFLDLLNHSGDVAVETGLDLVAGEQPGYQLVTRTGVARHHQGTNTCHVFQAPAAHDGLPLRCN